MLGRLIAETNAAASTTQSTTDAAAAKRHLAIWRRASSLWSVQTERVGAYGFDAHAGCEGALIASALTMRCIAVTLSRRADSGNQASAATCSARVAAIATWCASAG